MSKWGDAIENVVIAAGCFFIVAVLFAATVFIVSALGQPFSVNSSPRLREGTVIDKYFSEGHDYQSTLVLGDYYVGKTVHGKDVYHIVIESGDILDDWDVSAEEFEGIEIGDYLVR